MNGTIKDIRVHNRGFSHGATSPSRSPSARRSEAANGKGKNPFRVVSLREATMIRAASSQIFRRAAPRAYQGGWYVL
jgi:hypothetical protein